MDNNEHFKVKITIMNESCVKRSKATYIENTV